MDAADSSLPVRQTTDQDVLDIRQAELISDTEIFALICAISASNPRTCDMCGSTEHIIAACPKVARLVKDPVTLKRLLFALDKARSSGGGPTSFSAPSAPSPGTGRSSTPTRSNRHTPIRSVLHDKEDTDTNVSINQLTDDEGADFGEAH